MPAPTLSEYEKHPAPMVTPVVIYRPDGAGGWSAQGNASASSYGVSSYRNTALSNTAQAVKATGGNIYSVQIINVNPNAVFLKLYNIAAASVSVGASAVRRTLLCPGGSLANPGYLYLHGDNLPLFANFDTAISVACTANLADSDNTPPATAINTNIIYA